MKRNLPRLFALACAVVLGACAPTRFMASRMGPCRWNTETLQFEIGDAGAQARCLLRHVRQGGVLGPAWPLPPTLGRLVGTPAIPTRDQLRSYVARRDLSPGQRHEWDVLMADLDRPISHGWDNRADAPAARYFVIHDTSEPYLATAPFPKTLDSDPDVNDLGIYFRAPFNDPVAHVFTNRRGEIRIGHTFSTPWRATKRERFTDQRNKGMFIHIENGQPRRQNANGPRGETTGPRPGFGERQYDTLALLYMTASIQAGRWLIPGFHSAIDEGIKDKHDDPQHFDLQRFDRSLARLVRAVEAVQGATPLPSARK